MRPRECLAAFLTGFLILFTSTPALHAQTLQVQAEVEAKLWFQRWLDRASSPEGQRAILVFVLIAMLLLLLLLWRRWVARQKRERTAD